MWKPFGGRLAKRIIFSKKENNQMLNHEKGNAISDKKKFFIFDEKLEKSDP